MIRDELEKLKEEKYKEFSEKLIPGIKIIGVRLPILRKLSKKITLEELTDNSFEEVMLQGMIIGNIKDINEFKKRCIEFLPKINNWSVCDSFVSSIHITNNYNKEMFDFLNSLLTRKEIFIKRFILVMYLRYFICDEYIDKVLNNIRKIKIDGYYVEMAYAWCLTEVYLKYKDKFFEFTKREYEKISSFTIKKTISKIKESKKTNKTDIDELIKIFNKDSNINIIC